MYVLNHTWQQCCAAYVRKTVCNVRHGKKKNKKVVLNCFFFVIIFLLLFYIAHFSSPLITNIPCARPNTEQRRMHLGH